MRLVFRRIFKISHETRLCVRSEQITVKKISFSSAWSVGIYPGFLWSMEKCGHFPSWKSLETIFFVLLIWKRKIIFQTWSFDLHFHNIFIKFDNFTLIMLTFIVPVFDLGMSFGKFKSGNLYSKLRSKPVCRILRRVTTSFAYVVWNHPLLAAGGLTQSSLCDVTCYITSERWRGVGREYRQAASRRRLSIYRHLAAEDATDNAKPRRCFQDRLRLERRCHKDWRNLQGTEQSQGNLTLLVWLTYFLSVSSTAK